MSKDPRMTLKARYINRQKTLSKMGFATYQEYLASDLWAEIKSRVMDRDKTCRLCGGPAYTVHHLDYTRQAMTGSDGRRLIAVCNKCHYRVEFKGGEKLLDSNSISRKARERKDGKRSKRIKPFCRCCERQFVVLGRNDICMVCYRRYGAKVHELADARST